MNNIKKNLVFQTAYQVLSVCIPLITAPYLARKLGASQLGVFSYTSSVVAYFTLFAMLGTVNYGTKSIAAAKTDKDERSRIFFSIFLLQVMVTVVALIAYGGYLVFLCRDNEIIALLQGIAIISCFLDINWFFWGIEEFQITVIRNIIIKLFTVFFIVTFINDSSDLWLYTLIMLGGTFLSNLILFFYLPKYISFVGVPFYQIKQHVMPNLMLFIPLLAMSVYHTMDKTMLGIFSNYEESGFYYNSDKIVQMPLLIINGIGTVMLPRMSALISNNKKNEATELFMTTLEGVAAVSIAIASVIAGIANEFLPFFFGAGYEACISITIIFTPILLIKGFSVIVRTQYLIPMGLEKEFTKSVFGGALINLLLNLVLIPKYGAMGATIATVIAELVACVIQFYSIRGFQLGIKSLIIKTGKYVIIGGVMIAFIRLMSIINLNDVLKIVIEAISGIVFYTLVCIYFWKKSNSKMIFFFKKDEDKYK